MNERDYYHKKTKRFTGAATKDYVMLLLVNYEEKEAIIIVLS